MLPLASVFFQHLVLINDFIDFVQALAKGVRSQSFLGMNKDMIPNMPRKNVGALSEILGSVTSRQQPRDKKRDLSCMTGTTSGAGVLAYR